MIGPTTGKKVVRQCDGCGRVSITTMQSSACLCHSCGKKKHWIELKSLAVVDPSKAFWVRSQGKTKRLVCSCGSIEEMAGLDRTVCLKCSKVKADRLIAIAKKSRPNSVLLVEETKSVFGYDPITLSKSDKRKVVRMCGGCGEHQVVRLDHFYKLCMSCASHLDWKVKVEAYKELGLTPTGRDASSLREKSNAWRRAFDADRKVSEVGRLRGILYATLGQMIKGDVAKSRNLPYTAFELKEHIRQEIEKFGGCCPMCGVEFSVSGYDIDHKVPTSLAKTVEEMQTAFELNNLSVLSPDCNRRVKKAKIIVYDEIRSIKGGTPVAQAVGGVN